MWQIRLDTNPKSLALKRLKQQPAKVRLGSPGPHRSVSADPCSRIAAMTPAWRCPFVERCTRWDLGTGLTGGRYLDCDARPTSYFRGSNLLSSLTVASGMAAR